MKPNPSKLAAIHRANAEREIGRLRKALKVLRDLIQEKTIPLTSCEKWMIKVIDKALAGIE